MKHYLLILFCALTGCATTELDYEIPRSAFRQPLEQTSGDEAVPVLLETVEITITLPITIHLFSEKEIGKPLPDWSVVTNFPVILKARVPKVSGHQFYSGQAVWEDRSISMFNAVKVE